MSKYVIAGYLFTIALLGTTLLGVVHQRNSARKIVTELVARSVQSPVVCLYNDFTVPVSSGIVPIGTSGVCGRDLTILSGYFGPDIEAWIESQFGKDGVLKWREATREAILVEEDTSTKGIQ